MFPDALVRLSCRGAYCSGTLLAPDIVLTCAHFFQEYPDGVVVRSRGKIRTIKTVDIVPGTDIAVVRIRPFHHLGDSGGPVLVGGRIAGIQSLIVDPLGCNSHVAVVNLLTEPLREKLEVRTAEVRS